jgi:GrpB-like predicted nucleotidyltransferase (UPF0157 family)
MEYLVNRISRPVVVVPHQQRWRGEFKVVGSAIRTILGESALRIDHIGSTSVPGLSAKDIIDIQITVSSLDDFSRIQELMVTEGGFRPRGEIHEDHIPPGVNQDPLEWRKRYFREPEAAKRTHIHVREMNRKNQKYPLLFRDFLRNDETSRKLYELIKIRLAELFPHKIDSYLYIKDPACDLIMQSAIKWKKETNWQLGPSDE